MSLLLLNKVRHLSHDFLALSPCSPCVHVTKKHLLSAWHRIFYSTVTSAEFSREALANQITIIFAWQKGTTDIRFQDSSLFQLLVQKNIIQCKHTEGGPKAQGCRGTSCLKLNNNNYLISSNSDKTGKRGNC